MKNNVAGILAGTMIVLIVLSLSLFVVDQRQNVIVLRDRKSTRLNSSH